MIRVPDTGIAALRKQAPTGLSLLHLVSLQPLGGPLKTSVAAALNGDVMVYDLSAAAASPTAPSPPKAYWKAHDTPISSIHRSSFACALFTGSLINLSHYHYLKTWNYMNVEELISLFSLRLCSV